MPCPAQKSRSRTKEVPLLWYWACAPPPSGGQGDGGRFWGNAKCFCRHYVLRLSCWTLCNSTPHNVLMRQQHGLKATNMPRICRVLIAAIRTATIESDTPDVAECGAGPPNVHQPTGEKQLPPAPACVHAQQVGSSFGH